MQIDRKTGETALMNETEKNDIRQYEKDLLERVLSSILQKGGDCLLSSIVLTGSFGRSEPTYTVREDGSFQLKSDVEIALIFTHTFQKKKVEKLIGAVSAEFEEDLNLMAISEQRVRKACNFNMSFVEPRKKTVFTFDLFNGSKTIWGQELLQLKAISAFDVDPYEGKRLIANRIGELVYLQGNHKTNAGSRELRMQWKGKVMLAIASAWLIITGEYVSPYREQYEKIKRSSRDVNNVLGSAFFAEYEKTFLFLRCNGQPYEVCDNNLYSFVKRMDEHLSSRGINKPRINTVSRRVKYIIKYLKAGMPYGLRNFEEIILQKLIDSFYLQSKDLNDIAQIWHHVLY